MRTPHKLPLCILGVIALLAAAGTAADTPLPVTPYTATYRAKADGIPIGIMNRTLRTHPDGEFELATNMHTTGLISLFRDERLLESSRFRVSGDKLISLAYRYEQYNGKNLKKKERIDFDWDAGTADSHFDGRNVTLPLSEGVLDKLNYQLALRRDLKEGAEELRYPVIDDDVLKEYHFRLIGREPVNTPIGTLPAAKMERIHGGKKRRRTVIWCSEQHGYLVLQIEQYTDDHTFAIYLTDLSMQSDEVVDSVPIRSSEE